MAHTLGAIVVGLSVLTFALIALGPLLMDAD